MLKISTTTKNWIFWFAQWDKECTKSTPKNQKRQPVFYNNIRYIKLKIAKDAQCVDNVLMPGATGDRN